MIFFIEKFCFWFIRNETIVRFRSIYPFSLLESTASSKVILSTKSDCASILFIFVFSTQFYGRKFFLWHRVQAFVFKSSGLWRRFCSSDMREPRCMFPIYIGLLVVALDAKGFRELGSEVEAEEDQSALSILRATWAASSNVDCWGFKTSSLTSLLRPCTKQLNFSPSDISLIVNMQFRKSVKYFETNIFWFRRRNLSRALHTWLTGTNSVITILQKSSQVVGVWAVCTTVYHQEAAFWVMNDVANIIQFSSVIFAVGVERRSGLGCYYLRWRFWVVLDRIEKYMGRWMFNGTTHSSSGSIFDCESPKNYFLRRFTQLGGVECSNRYVTAAVGVGFDVVEGRWRTDSVVRNHDTFASWV